VSLRKPGPSLRSSSLQIGNVAVWNDFEVFDDAMMFSDYCTNAKNATAVIDTFKVRPGRGTRAQGGPGVLAGAGLVGACTPVNPTPTPAANPQDTVVPVGKSVTIKLELTAPAQAGVWRRVFALVDFNWWVRGGWLGWAGLGWAGWLKLGWVGLGGWPCLCGWQSTAGTAQRICRHVARPLISNRTTHHPMRSTNPTPVKPPTWQAVESFYSEKFYQVRGGRLLEGRPACRAGCLPVPCAPAPRAHRVLHKPGPTVPPTFADQARQGVSQRGPQTRRSTVRGRTQRLPAPLLPCVRHACTRGAAAIAGCP
jgi:hypothetical protein